VHTNEREEPPVRRESWQAIPGIAGRR